MASSWARIDGRSVLLVSAMRRLATSISIVLIKGMGLSTARHARAELKASLSRQQKHGPQ